MTGKDEEYDRFPGKPVADSEPAGSGEVADHETALEALADELRGADRAVALTGAGLSAASGIPTFRGDGGIWGGLFDERDFRVHRFERDPAGFWADRLEFYDHMTPEGGADPNPAHEALATLENEGMFDAVITQNTDGLHDDAGTRDVIELHGSNSRVVCHRCGRSKRAGLVRERARGGELPPRCDESTCEGPYKPDVVLFGERLPEKALERSRRVVAASDVVLVAGSSLTVDPAASLPGQQGSGTLAIVNLEPTRYTGAAEYDFREDVVELLPKLTNRVLNE